MTTIAILDEIIILKTPKLEGTKKINNSDFGYPDVDDVGYIAIEFFELIAETFHAKYTVIGNECWLVPLINDSFWIKRSTYTASNTLTTSEVEQYNINELNASLNITFATDTEDKFTVRNYGGTGYEVQTNQTNLINKRNSTLNGVDDVLIPYALGTPRTEKTPVEKVIFEILTAVDNIVKQADLIVKRFGGSIIKSNYAGLVSSRFNVLKTTSDFWSVPKMMRMKQSGNDYILGVNYRSGWSAQFLYENYHIDKSFVSNGNRNQWRIVENVRIPFGFSDFVKLTTNSYFYTHDGKDAKAEKIEWFFGADYAIISYRYREVYNTNLIETFIDTTD